VCDPVTGLWADGTPCTVPPIVIDPFVPPAECPEWILFHTFRDDNLEIYRLDGYENDEGVEFELFNLSNDAATDSRPSRSPDYSLVVFQSAREGNIELYLTDNEGESQWRLTETEANNINAMFGPDNQTVVFQSDRNGNWDIFIVDTATGEERQLTTDPADDINPFWSPDPRYIVFESTRNGDNSDLYIFDLETGEEYQVTRGVTNETFPSWSPNGRQLAFLSDVNGLWTLFVSDLDGENVLQITDGETMNPTWSPEGYRLAYQVEREDDQEDNLGELNLDVYTYDLRTEQEYRLTQYFGQDSAPTWDCGGANVAFTSDRDGNMNIFQVYWAGGPQSNLTDDEATDKWSEWSPTREPGSRGF
jgi:TolB protein